MPSKRKKTKKITVALSECHISTHKQLPSDPNDDTHKKAGASLVFAEQFEPNFFVKWPTPSLKVPDIFLHKPIDFTKHARKLLAKGINFYHPILCRYGTKISCLAFDDHKAMVQYFDTRRFPYHTFGHPSKRKMKVVIRGLTNDVNLNILKSELKGGSIPIVRIHKMQKCKNARDNNKSLIMVVVPNDDKGRRLLLIKQIFGHDVTMEPVNPKTKQCYRCQMWGHSQRYCHGGIKCVKCAGNHLSKKCDRNPEDPIRCVNCGQEGHVASWRDCARCPDSETYKLAQERKKAKIQRRPSSSQPLLVTMQSCHELYDNVKYDYYYY